MKYIFIIGSILFFSSCKTNKIPQEPNHISKKYNLSTIIQPTIGDDIRTLMASEFYANDLRYRLEKHISNLEFDYQIIENEMIEFDVNNIDETTVNRINKLIESDVLTFAIANPLTVFQTEAVAHILSGMPHFIRTNRSLDSIMNYKPIGKIASDLFDVNEFIALNESIQVNYGLKVARSGRYVSNGINMYSFYIMDTLEIEITLDEIRDFKISSDNKNIYFSLTSKGAKELWNFQIIEPPRNQDCLYVILDDLVIGKSVINEIIPGRIHASTIHFKDDAIKTERRLGLYRNKLKASIISQITH